MHLMDNISHFSLFHIMVMYVYVLDIEDRLYDSGDGLWG